jgi:glycosyl transferase family 2
MERRRRLRNLRHLPWLLGELLRAGPRVGAIEAQLNQLDRRHALLEQLVEGELRPILRALLAEEAENRRRLYRLREDPDYELAFEDEEPLVSVTVATHDRAELLRSRSLPSILGQSYPKLEVIVVGDHVGPETQEAVESLGDERLTYRNLSQRTVAVDDPKENWFVASTMARNEANRTAHGRWLVPFDDDDSMRPDHVETLLEAARARRLEVAYGRFRTHLRDGSSFDSGSFPPQPQQLGWPAAIQHAGLRFFERELAAAALRVPGDWFLLERMLRAGVRFGFVDQLVLDYYPSLG